MVSGKLRLHVLDLNGEHQRIAEIFLVDDAFDGLRELIIQNEEAVVTQALVHIHWDSATLPAAKLTRRRSATVFGRFMTLRR